MSRADRFKSGPAELPQLERRVKGNPLPIHPDSDHPLGATRMGRFPLRLHRTLPKGGGLWETEAIMRKEKLHTVCEEAKCPNRVACWSERTATYLVLGHACTRACGFCEIAHTEAPPPPDPEEPGRIAASAAALALRHIVVTMVARDDLADGGAAHLVAILRALREKVPGVTTEFLISDLEGNLEALALLLAESPDVFNHNIETIERLTPRVRHKATYARSLSLLAHAAVSAPRSLIKSGLMVGLGEEVEEVETTLRDLHEAGVEVVTIGQYLQANRNKLRVKRFVSDEEFHHYRLFGEKIGLKRVQSSPFVRSSYQAGSLYRELSMQAV